MTAPSPTEQQAIAAAKSASTAQLLFKCARLVNELALERLRLATGQALRPAHTALFPLIDLEGTRLTEIARRAGVSKQAVAPLVDELVAMGALEKVPDPSDGRARLLRFARGPDGRSGLLAGLALLGTLEAELQAALGGARWFALHDALSSLEPLLESWKAEDPAG